MFVVKLMLLMGHSKDRGENSVETVMYWFWLNVNSWLTSALPGMFICLPSDCLKAGKGRMLYKRVLNIMSKLMKPFVKRASTSISLWSVKRPIEIS